VACNVVKGLKGFERKGIKAQKTMCGFLFIFFVTKIINLVLKDSLSFC